MILRRTLLVGSLAIVPLVSAVAYEAHVTHYICKIGRESFDIGIDLDYADAVVTPLTGHKGPKGYAITIAGSEISYDKGRGRHPVIIDLQRGLLIEDRRQGHCEPVTRDDTSHDPA